MRSNRSFRQFGRSGCGSCCGGCSCSGFRISRVTYQRRFLNVPMRVFNGAGFTSRDALESIADSMQTISQRSCSDCDNCSNCSGCSNWGCRNNSGGCGNRSGCGNWSGWGNWNNWSNWNNGSGCGCC